ncbi:MAG: Fe-S cluster assembly protein SufD [Deltaproteobacteria bacterium]|nr:Fe-S cluster assembly protein SufD [Deltaproteobacteria bacterium]
MSSAAQAKTLYESHFSEMEKGGLPNGKAWIRNLRERAMARFNGLGFPTSRNEEWKYTDVAPIANTVFQPARRGLDRDAADAAARAALGSFEACRLVFVNGYYEPGLSSPRPPLEGVEISSLAATLEGDGGWLEPHLARYAGYENHAFVALNTALMGDGAALYVPPGRILTEPIQLLFISVAGPEPEVSHPRILIVIGKGSQASVVESYLGAGEGVYLVNAVTELVIGENGVVEHYKLQRESERAYHIATLQAHLAGSANFSSHSIALGGILARNEINAVLDGEGCECALNGLYLASGEQHVDNHTRIDHVKPHGTSRELYKGVLDGKARGIFNGKIYVHKAAHKTDAKQTNKNLLLSRGAWVDTKPQLEIYNNDVKCSHGSTIGQLDQDAIFYLRSRGIGVETARSLLTYAFASDIINRIKIEPMRVQLDRLLAGKFQADSPAGREP